MSKFCVFLIIFICCDFIKVSFIELKLMLDRKLKYWKGYIKHVENKHKIKP